MFKKLMFLLFVVFLSFTVTGLSAEATTFNFEDMPLQEEWSYEPLSKAVENGLLQGYNNKIMPDNSLTRAEMATIINRSFGAISKADIERFTDLSPSAWFYDEMAKAVRMKTFQGDGNLLYPNDDITREQAFIVIARALRLPKTQEAPTGFEDLDQISPWAKEEVYSMIHAGYVHGANGYLNPKGLITRAEFAQLMHNIIKEYLTEAGEYTVVSEGNVMVNAPDITLKNLTIEGDLIIGDGVGEGTVILDNVKVTGILVVRGGGQNSIIIRGGSQLGRVIVAKVDGVVRVFTEEGAEVEVIQIDDGEDQIIIEGTLTTLEVKTSVPVVLRNATIKNVQVEAPKSNITVDSSSIVTNVYVSNTSEQTKLIVEGTVQTVITEAPQTTVSGEGTVETVEVQEGANDTSITTTNTTITVSEGVEGTTGTGGTTLESGQEYINADDPEGEALPVEEPVPAPIPTPGPVPTTSDYGFQVVKNGTPYLLDDEINLNDNQILTYNLVVDLLNLGLDQYVDDISEYTGFFERALEKTIEESSNTYAFSLANRIKNTSESLDVLAYSGAVKTLVDKIISQNNALVEDIEEFATIMVSGSIGDLISDLQKLYPGEDAPAGITFKVGERTGFTIDNLSTEFNAEFSSTTVQTAASQSKDLITLSFVSSQGTETLIFRMVAY
ncbi:MAG: S-layer homology domain-containing protein [Tissierellales bacterium]|nr:S-layer homology domain-containing protein [Tissierellales bacterium]